MLGSLWVYICFVAEVLSIVLILAIIVLIIILSWLGISESRHNKRLLRAFNNGTVAVDVKSKDNSRLCLCRIYAPAVASFKMIGSAAFVRYGNKKYILTAKHVIYDKERKLFSSPSFLIELQDRIYVISDCFSQPDMDEEASITASVAFLDKVYLCDDPDDLAIIPIKTDLETDLVLSEDLELDIDDEIECYGYPSGRFVKSVGRLLLVAHLMARHHLLEHTAFIYYGSSGSPVIKIVGDEKFLAGINFSIQAKGTKDHEYKNNAISYHAAIQTIEDMES